MKHQYFDFDLLCLSAHHGATQLDQQFVVIDNLDEEHADSEAFFVNYPVKLSFVIAIFCVQGDIRFRINLQEYALHANDLLVVSQGTIGECVGMERGTKIAVIAFAGKYFTGSLHVEETMLLQRRLFASPLCHLPQEAMQECLAIYRLAKAKIAEKENPFRSMALMGYAQVLTSSAYQYLVKHKDDKMASASRQYELYTRFMDEVRKAYTQQRAIGYYAERLCVTPKYLSQVVRAASGRFAGEWIADFVILEAKAMLKSRRYSIQQVADSLNFATQSFFGKYFKDRVGMSPSEYMRKG